MIFLLTMFLKAIAKSFYSDKNAKTTHQLTVNTCRNSISDAELAHSNLSSGLVESFTFRFFFGCCVQRCWGSFRAGLTCRHHVCGFMSLLLLFTQKSLKKPQNTADPRVILQFSLLVILLFDMNTHYFFHYFPLYSHPFNIIFLNVSQKGFSRSSFSFMFPNL